MEIDLTFINVHFLLSTLVALLFLNVYEIYTINKQTRTAPKTRKAPVKKEPKKTVFTSRVEKRKPKVNDDLAFIKKQNLMDEDERDG